MPNLTHATRRKCNATICTHPQAYLNGVLQTARGACQAYTLCITGTSRGCYHGAMPQDTINHTRQRSRTAEGALGSEQSNWAPSRRKEISLNRAAMVTGLAAIRERNQRQDHKERTWQVPSLKVAHDSRPRCRPKPSRTGICDRRNTDHQFTVGSHPSGWLRDALPVNHTSHIPRPSRMPK